MSGIALGPGKAHGHQIGGSPVLRASFPLVEDAGD